MLTNDTDFLVLAARCAADKETFAPIYFWPQQGRPVGEMVRGIRVGKPGRLSLRAQRCIFSEGCSP